MTLFMEKYRNESGRCQEWNYSSSAYYFVTIMARSRRHLFGNITDGKMILNQNGMIAYEWVSKIPTRFPGTTIVEHAIMPDHVHLLIGIVLGEYIPTRDNVAPALVDTDNDVASVSIGTDDNVVSVPIVGTIHELSLQSHTNQQCKTRRCQPDQQCKPDRRYRPNQYRRRKMLIPKIIGYYKMNTAKRINELRKTAGIPVWQARYHDRIIKSDDELWRVRKYIADNPTNWRTCPP